MTEVDFLAKQKSLSKCSSLPLPLFGGLKERKGGRAGGREGGGIDYDPATGWDKL